MKYLIGGKKNEMVEMEETRNSKRTKSNGHKDGNSYGADCRCSGIYDVCAEFIEIDRD